MFRLDSKKIIIAVFPFIVLILAWVLAMGTLVSFNKLSAVFLTLPYILAFFALVLSVWFQHSRVFYAICILLFIMSVVSAGVERLNQAAFINGISIVIPLSFVLLAVAEEKGITSKHGLIKGLVLIALILIVLVDAGSKNPFLAKLKPARLLFGGTENIQGIPGLSVFLFVLCLCVMMVNYLIKSAAMDMAFTGISMGCFVILHFTEYPDVLSIFYSAVFLIFIIALFEASYSLAFSDPLTGILSRRAMEHEILRLGNRYTIAIIDIDHFKRINDKYGHKVGDDVLKMVAAIIEYNVSGGKAFRYGGEEFVVIYPKRQVKEIINQLDNLRIKVERRPFILRSADRPKNKPKRRTAYYSGGDRESVNVTVSIGIACKRESMTAADVIDEADKALYRAKRNGRNCVAY